MGIQNSIHAILSELGLKAGGAGYDPQNAIDRLAYGSFVSPARRYFYMETPKAACTAFKHFIAVVEGVAVRDDALPYQRETRTEMLVHQRRHLAVANLINADTPSRTAVLNGEAGWFIFAVVRNPFSRVVSFFENKIRLGEPGYRHLEARYGDPARHGGVRRAFGVFAEEVVADPSLRRGDYHLQSQAELIMPRLIPYSHIFRLEEADAAMKHFASHLGIPAPAADWSYNRSPNFSRDWRCHYDARSAAIVADAYREDFALYDYDVSGWQGTAEADEPSAADEYWRRELVARNAMIDRLYSRLGVPPALNPAELRLIQSR